MRKTGPKGLGYAKDNIAFWFWAAWKTGQVGIFVIVCLYTYVWGLGIYNNWIKRP